MKILIVNSNDIRGGAARAANRLHKGLQAIGIDSKMLVQNKYSDDKSVVLPVRRMGSITSELRPRLDSLLIKMYSQRIQIPFSPACVPFSGIPDAVNILNPDIVHLHWVAAGMLSVSDIAKINRPIVWTLHDMWAFTGGCHYDNGCGKYENECSRCPALGSSCSNDLSRYLFRVKRNVYKNIPRLTVVGLSRWLSKCAAQSTLLRDRKIVNLPNPIDTYVFSPFSSQMARTMLGLPLDKKLVLCGADSIGDYLKGFDVLPKALEKIARPDIEVVILGASGVPGQRMGGHRVNFLGKLFDDISLRMAYAAADIVMLPSLQENLSNVVMESLSCGTPVVAFDLGGNGDMICHKQNGYLVDHKGGGMAFAQGIEWLLDNYDSVPLRENARQLILEKFEITKVAQQYKLLYEEILGETD